VTTPWPPEFLDVLEWQWEKKAIPYWKDAAGFAADHGVKVALEAHPGFIVDVMSIEHEDALVLFALFFRAAEADPEATAAVRAA
jgi:sugar phosphate isomerase/epimerase